MSDQPLVTVTAITQSGDRQNFRCQKIVAIDGHPYSPPGEEEAKFDELVGYINNMEGRLQTLENMIGAMLNPHPTTDTQYPIS